MLGGSGTFHKDTFIQVLKWSVSWTHVRLVPYRTGRNMVWSFLKVFKNLVTALSILLYRGSIEKLRFGVCWGLGGHCCFRLIKQQPESSVEVLCFIFGVVVRFHFERRGITLIFMVFGFLVVPMVPLNLWHTTLLQTIQEQMSLFG